MLVFSILFVITLRIIESLVGNAKDQISNGCSGPHQLSDAVDICEIEETCGERAFLKRSNYKIRKKEKWEEKTSNTKCFV